MIAYNIYLALAVVCIVTGIACHASGMTAMGMHYVEMTMFCLILSKLWAKDGES